jgi:hypothetical protein
MTSVSNLMEHHTGLLDTSILVLGIPLSYAILSSMLVYSQVLPIHVGCVRESNGCSWRWRWGPRNVLRSVCNIPCGCQYSRCRRQHRFNVRPCLSGPWPRLTIWQQNISLRRGKCTIFGSLGVVQTDGVAWRHTTSSKVRLSASYQYHRSCSM